MSIRVCRVHRSHADDTRISGPIPVQWCQDVTFACTKDRLHDFYQVVVPPENACLPAECSVSQWCGLSTRCGDGNHCLDIKCGDIKSKSRCVNAKNGSTFSCICGPGYTGGGLGKLCEGTRSMLLMAVMLFARVYGIISATAATIVTVLIVAGTVMAKQDYT